MRSPFLSVPEDRKNALVLSTCSGSIAGIRSSFPPVPGTEQKSPGGFRLS